MKVFDWYSSCLFCSLDKLSNIIRINRKDLISWNLNIFHGRSKVRQYHCAINSACDYIFFPACTAPSHWPKTLHQSERVPQASLSGLILPLRQRMQIALHRFHVEDVDAEVSFKELPHASMQAYVHMSIHWQVTSSSLISRPWTWSKLSLTWSRSRSPSEFSDAPVVAYSPRYPFNWIAQRTICRGVNQSFSYCIFKKSWWKRWDAIACTQEKPSTNSRDTGHQWPSRTDLQS